MRTKIRWQTYSYAIDSWTVNCTSQRLLWDTNGSMSEEIDKHVLNKYEIQKKLGKGVRFWMKRAWIQRCDRGEVFQLYRYMLTIVFCCRHMGSFGKQLIRKMVRLSRWRRSLTHFRMLQMLRYFSLSQVFVRDCASLYHSSPLFCREHFERSCFFRSWIITTISSSRWL